MWWFSLLFLALALNMDALGVGISYGIRRIKLPFLSMVIICILSMGAISISMLAGHMIGHLVPPALCKHIGGVILLLLGMWATYQYFRQEDNHEAVDFRAELKNNIKETKQEPVTLLKVKMLGIMIHILKDPQIVDMDCSGVISGREAFLLGLALSLDSLGAGMAVSLLGFNVVDTAIGVGVGQFLFTYLGIKLGYKLRHISLGKVIAVLPGLILIFLGVSRLY